LPGHETQELKVFWKKPFWMLVEFNQGVGRRHQRDGTNDVFLGDVAGFFSQ